MACIRPRKIVNRHYVKIASENNESVDNYNDRDDYYVNVPCGLCIECLKRYHSEWRTRLMHEWEYMTKEQRNNSYFITLTFAPKYYDAPDFDIYKCKKRFIDVIRKKYGKSPRYWFITEMGELRGRWHLHGLIFDCNFDIYNLDKLWKYGIVDYSKIFDEKIGYCTSYINKYIDDIVFSRKHKQRVFCSPGLGLAYCLDKYNIRYHHPAPGVLNPIMQNSSGYMFPLPRYYRGKIFTDDEREDQTQDFWLNYSEDVIPDPPYRIGGKTFIDYTLYLAECAKYRRKQPKPRSLISDIVQTEFTI